MTEHRTAVIDLGSNSFRLVVFTDGNGWWRRTDEIYEPVRIGQGMVETGALGDEAMKRALATIEVFTHFCAAAEIPYEKVDAVATSAIREASNGPEFVARVREHSGLDVRVISREEEARYAYLAAVNSTTLRDGAVLDLGGGSMQLVQVADRLAVAVDSWRLGAVRMTERFLASGDPASRKDLDRLRSHVAGKLARAQWATAGHLGRLVGIGGTNRNLATAARRAADLPEIGVQGFLLGMDALDELVDRLAALPAGERGRISGIKPARADIVLAGAVTVQTVLRETGVAGLEVTEAGLREGMFFERHLPGEPPLSPDVRVASVHNLATQYGVDPAHTNHVASIALGLFDDLAVAGLHDGDPVERELLWAACILHDIGMAVDYDDHHKHTRYLILSAGLPGFTPSELALIAQITRYHRKGTPDAGGLASLLDERDRARLNRGAVLLRLGEDLERSRDQLVRAVEVQVDGDDVRLRLVADGEASVPRWAARREVELFARAFGGARLIVD
jgi:exopolyphosphatase / guanosine-5'-triphosphate,3'-diphosphate pyrophosphatase